MPEDLLRLAPARADFRIPYGPNASQFGELRLAKSKGQHAIVMNVHGGFWRKKYDLAHAGHFCAALSAVGLATWNIEYRRVGEVGGGWPGALDDVRQAWRFIPQLAEKYDLSGEKVIVVGHSAGGHLALCLAAYERGVRAVVSLAGVVDLQRAWELQLSSNAVVEFLSGSPQDVPQNYRAADPMQLAIPEAAQWIVHGAQDDIVPPDFSHLYCERKKNQGENVHHLEIPKADHFDLIDPRAAAWPIVVNTILGLSG
jgi:acetyl esterase/lipase